MVTLVRRYCFKMGGTKAPFIYVLLCTVSELFVGPTLDKRKNTTTTKVRKFLDLMAPPIYFLSISRIFSCIYNSLHPLYTFLSVPEEIFWILQLLFCNKNLNICNTRLDELNMSLLPEPSFDLITHYYILYILRHQTYSTYSKSKRNINISVNHLFPNKKTDQLGTSF